MSGRFRLNTFCRIRFGPPPEIDLPLEKQSYELPDERFVGFLAGCSTPESHSNLIGQLATILGTERASATDVIDDLVERMILVEDGATEHELMPGVRHWENRGWLDALFLHLASTNLAYDDDGADNTESVQSAAMQEILTNEEPPEFWKQYPGAPQIDLPDAEELPDRESLQSILLRRRSNEPWRRGEIDLSELSSMLWLGSAETRRVRNDVALELSSNPSALFNSAFTAIEVYIFAFNVNGLPPGLYHYDPKKHSVACLRKGDLQNEVTKMCVGQARAGSGACALAFSGVWKRYMYRYRHPRAYRTLLVNIAELAQKHLILATALSLSTFVTPAFNDELADRLLDVEGFDEAVLELIAFG